MLITPIPYDYMGTYPTVILKVHLFTHTIKEPHKYNILILEDLECVYKDYECYDFDSDKGTRKYNVDFLINDISLKYGCFMFDKYPLLHFNLKERTGETSFKIKCCILD